MFDSNLRKVKDRILVLFSKTPIFKWKPNSITTISFIFGLLSLYFLYFNNLRMAFLLFLLNRIVDGLDGLVARETNRQTDFGGYYDIMTDFFIYSLIPLVIAWRLDDPMIWILTAILLAVFYINGASWMYLAGLLEKEIYKSGEKGPTSLSMPRGVIEGTETIIFYSLMILLPAGHFWYLLIMSLLTLTAVPQRMIFARKVLK
jgi:phosphatidylglycerophosphate synthase